MAVPGIGLQTATAMVAAIVDRAFEKGSGFAARPGFRPRENSTGGKQPLGNTSKLGNEYLRTLLPRWLRAEPVEAPRRAEGVAAAMLGERKQSVAIVALTAWLARIAWALLRRGERFAPKPEAEALGRDGPPRRDKRRKKDTAHRIGSMNEEVALSPSVMCPKHRG